MTKLSPEALYEAAFERPGDWGEQAREFCLGVQGFAYTNRADVVRYMRGWAELLESMLIRREDFALAAE